MKRGRARRCERASGRVCVSARACARACACRRERERVFTFMLDSLLSSRRRDSLNMLALRFLPILNSVMLARLSECLVGLAWRCCTILGSVYLPLLPVSAVAPSFVGAKALSFSSARGEDCGAMARGCLSAVGCGNGRSRSTSTRSVRQRRTLIGFGCRHRSRGPLRALLGGSSGRQSGGQAVTVVVVTVVVVVVT